MTGAVSLNKRVSVVIPLYNHENYIEQALESVITQSAKPLEIIVVDDGSGDASADKVRHAAARCPELVYWSQPNQGAHKAINAGVHRAQGEIVAILNSDDAFHPQRLEECLHVLDELPDVSVVATGLEFMDDSGRSIPNSWYERAKAFFEKEGDLSLALVNGNFIMTTSNLVIRRSVFEEIGYFSALRYAHDLDFMLRLVVRDKNFHLLDKALINYRMHATNTISEDVIKVKTEWAAVVAYFIYSHGRNRARAERDWEYYGRLTGITDNHGLTAYILHFLKYFDSLPPCELTCDAYMRDGEFCRFLATVIK